MAPTFIFAGGGTGGHLYPGLAIAERLADRTNQHARTLFVCSDRAIDREVLSKQSVEFRVLRARPFGIRPGALVRFLRSWGKTVRESRAMLRELAGGSEKLHVVAMGGFVAAPVVQAARVERIPVTLVNLDAVPGKANKWIARHVERVFSALPVAESPAYARDWKTVGPIVRRDAAPRGTPASCRTRLGLDPDRRTLMVTGGSLGARSLNQFVARFVGDRSGALEGWQVLHQTGKEADDSIAAAYAAADIPAKVVQFSDAMSDWWGAADLAIARAGAGNVAEVWANHVPTVFLPYPYHRDQHQKYNAAPLAETGGCWVCTDQIDPGANMTGAGQLLAELLGDPQRLSAARTALAKLGPADGADRVAAALLG